GFSSDGGSAIVTFEYFIKKANDSLGHKLGFYYGGGLNCALNNADKEAKGKCNGIGFEIIEEDSGAAAKFVIFAGSDVWSREVDMTEASYNSWQTAEVSFDQQQNSSECGGATARISLSQLAGGDYLVDYDMDVDLNKASQDDAKAIFFGVTDTATEAGHRIRNVAINTSRAEPNTTISSPPPVTLEGGA
ncbi:unnamed protein product, partial [Heterosigma akashiwo]